MPAWWRKKPSSSKDSESKSERYAKGSSIKNEKKRGIGNGHAKDNKAKSFDGVSEMVFLRRQSRKSRDFASGFSGFDSASSSLDRGHPLPRPSEPSNEQDHVRGVGTAYGWGSVSSVSSSVSSDDLARVVVDNAAFRGHGDNKLSPLLRSPGQGLKGTTNTTSPLHPRFFGVNLDSSTGKLEDGKSESHRLPLPPGSPTSTTKFPAPRSPGITESSTSNSSKWRKGRLLGRGTFGHVYLGFNCENGQMCAMKDVRLILDDQSSEESLKQLNQEIDLLSRLSHANIVQYYGSDLSEETLSVYLEYVPGGSIQKLLQEYGPFGEPVIQNYTRQILLGLAYLHGRNTVHRDIKGANILVGSNGEIKLADFGMAKPITSISSMFSFKGSPYWMAPEVVMNTNGYSLPVDIWSLGCTVLEMATSKPPWGQYEGVAAIFKIGNSKDIPEIPDQLSNDAKSFIRLCLQREPSARPTASQLLSHPFLRNQTTIRAANVNITREVFPCASDGSRTQTAPELHSSRTHNSSVKDEASRTTVSKILLSPRESARPITSFPVSLASSPLRNYSSGNKTCFLSPPHLSCTSEDGSLYHQRDYSVFPVTPIKSTLDPVLEIPQFKAQRHVRSPTGIIILYKYRGFIHQIPTHVEMHLKISSSTSVQQETHPSCTSLNKFDWTRR